MGERFALRPAFARETPLARERLAENRTIKVGGVAGVATVGAAGAEVAQEVLAETQDPVPPLVSYLDSLDDCSVPRHWQASRSRSTRAWTTGSPARRRQNGEGMSEDFGSNDEGAVPL